LLIDVANKTERRTDMNIKRKNVWRWLVCMLFFAALVGTGCGGDDLGKEQSNLKIDDSRGECGGKCDGKCGDRGQNCDGECGDHMRGCRGECDGKRRGCDGECHGKRRGCNGDCDHEDDGEDEDTD
jgi:hypothetical protein